MQSDVHPVRAIPRIKADEADMHRVAQHRIGIAGVEALSLVSDHAFPRHSHEGYGIGVLLFGAHRSWSSRGAVAAAPGDVITVNPCEIHDERPVAGAVRGWRMLYLALSAIARETANEVQREIEIARPVLCDPEAATLIPRAFARLANSAADPLAAEEGLLTALMRFVRHHGVRAPPRAGPSAPVARALRRLDEAPERSATLQELAG